MNFYPDAGLYYNFRPLPSQELITEIITMLGEKLSPPFETAIDVGCGSGQLTMMLSPYFKKVIGIDNNVGQIEKAREENTFANITYQVGSTDKMELDNCSVDLVIACEAIHWFDLPSFYLEVDRILKPNGLLAACGYIYPEPVLEPYTEKFLLIIKEWFAKHKHFWAPTQYNLLNNRYQDIILPYSRTKKIDSIPSDKSVTMAHVIGHVKSRSGIQRLNEQDPEAAIKVVNELKSSLFEVIDGSSYQKAEDINLILRFNYFLIMSQKP